MLARIVAIDVIAGAILVVTWYFWFRRYNRQKALKVLHWIERAFQGHGEVAGLHWETNNRFVVQLRLRPSMFRRSLLKVELLPRELAIGWMFSYLRNQRETLTFEADLDSAPGFNLEVHNHRWCGRARQRLPQAENRLVLEQAGPFVITSRNDWQREITSMMGALLASRECDCRTVCFRRSSPHFSVTVPLDTIAPASAHRSEIFDVLRELAAGAASARF